MQENWLPLGGSPSESLILTPLCSSARLLGFSELSLGCAGNANERSLEQNTEEGNDPPKQVAQDTHSQQRSSRHGLDGVLSLMALVLWQVKRDQSNLKVRTFFKASKSMPV